MDLRLQWRLIRHAAFLFIGYSGRGSKIYERQYVQHIWLLPPHSSSSSLMKRVFKNWGIKNRAPSQLTHQQFSKLFASLMGLEVSTAFMNHYRSGKDVSTISDTYKHRHTLIISLMGGWKICVPGKFSSQSCDAILYCVWSSVTCSASTPSGSADHWTASLNLHIWPYAILQKSNLCLPE